MFVSRFISRFWNNFPFVPGVYSELGAQAVESLLEFTYSGILRVNMDTMWLLHYVSEKMAINEAVQLCEAFICETLGKDS